MTISAAAPYVSSRQMPYVSNPTEPVRPKSGAGEPTSNGMNRRAPSNIKMAQAQKVNVDQKAEVEQPGKDRCKKATTKLSRRRSGRQPKA